MNSKNHEPVALDNDADLGENACGARAVNLSYEKLDSSTGTKKLLSSQETDGDRRVIRFDLSNELKYLGRIVYLSQCLVATYSCNSFNMMMKVPCEKNFGEGGLEKKESSVAIVPMFQDTDQA